MGGRIDWRHGGMEDGYDSNSAGVLIQGNSFDPHKMRRITSAYSKRKGGGYLIIMSITAEYAADLDRIR